MTTIQIPIEVGEPDVAGPLCVFPLLGPEPKLRYRSFAQGCAQGVAVRELPGGASVNDLLVENASDLPVLLYEGEEVLGAQQNRTFDVSVLVGAESALKVPVSCVEAGRWQGSRHHERFTPAPQAAYPELRRAKHVEAARRVATGLEARADQSAVWQAVASKSLRHAVASPTSAMHDIFETHRGRLAEMHDTVRPRDCQVGALVAIGGRFCVLDMVGRADVFASLHGPLVQGYALDALEAGESEPPTRGDARGLVALVLDADKRPDPALGLGRRLRFAERAFVGSAIHVDGELVQLTAFVGDGMPSPRRPQQ